jgi:hypothetical protein
MKYSAACLAILPLLVMVQGCADSDAHVKKQSTSHGNPPRKRRNRQSPRRQAVPSPMIQQPWKP